MLADAKGRKPREVAIARGHKHLERLLEPCIEWSVSPNELALIEGAFHEVIMGRAAELVARGGLRLPQLSPVVEFKDAKWWFAVPGMYGGFSYWLEENQGAVRLVTESWCRVVGGSGQRHVVTTAGSELVQDGVEEGALTSGLRSGSPSLHGGV